MSTDLSMLAKRALRRSDEVDDYWDRAAHFLRRMIFKPIGERSRKEQNWLVELRLELEEPGD